MMLEINSSNTNRELYAYAMVKSLYDTGKDYIDLFIPFTLKVLNDHYPEMINITEIQNSLSDQFSLNIPIHVINQILNRAKKQRLVRQFGKNAGASIIGTEAINKLLPERDIERELNYFFCELKEFFLRKNIKIQDTQEMQNMFMQYITENIYCYSLFVGSKEKDLGKLNNANGNKYFKEFILEIEQSQPKLFQIFEDIIYGSIISILASGEALERKRYFSNQNLYLDTNIVFSILGYHHEDISYPCQELHAQLLKKKFKLFIFDFTLTEIVNVLNGYQRDYYKYDSQIEVDSIYSNLKTQGKTPSDIIETVSNIEIILEKYGIYIFTTTSFYDELNKKVQEKVDKLKKYKPEKSESSLRHDLVAIETIAKLRGDTYRKIDKARHFFLTSDLKLTQFNLTEYSHRDQNTVSEVILDWLLSTIIWVKSPDSDKQPSIETVLSLHAKTKYIGRNVWIRFIETLEKMYFDGEIEKNDLSILLYHGNIKDTLATMSSDDINEDYFKQVLLNIRDDFKENESELEKKEREICDLNLIVDKAEKENIKIKQSILDKVEEKITYITNKRINQIYVATLLIFLAIGELVSILTIRSYGYSYWTYIAPILGIPAIFGCSAKIIDWRLLITNKFKPKIQNYYRKKYYEEFIPESISLNSENAVRE